MDDTQEISQRIAAVKKQWGDRLLVLGHYYQRDEVLAHADAVGDSLELARRAAREKTAERIVFCGVHFMAESAALLAAPQQSVYLPDPDAGCPMADMAPAHELLKHWRTIYDIAADLLPVIYVNSSAAAKAFCGAQGGIACTSSNAQRVMQWVFQQGKRVFFLPDEHLGRNAASALGLPDEAVAVFDPGRPLGGLAEKALQSAKVIVWKGYCHVHAFTLDDLEQMRARYPGAKIIVHPETPAPVLRRADASGSTSQIIKYVEAAPAGATIVVGTEFNLVSRLGRQHGTRLTVVPLRVSVCPNMARITAAKLLHTLEKWPAEQHVCVSEHLRNGARLALQRMLDVS